MTPRQRAFCEHYAQCGIASEAARRAGYAQKTAYSQGARLLKDAEIQKYIRQLHDEAASARVATVTQVLATLSDILNDPKAKNSDRIRACEALLRSNGQFIRQEPQEDSGGYEVRIYLPQKEDGDD